MASSQDYYQTGICGGGWWNHGRSLFPPVSDFMWLDSSLNDMDEQVDQMKQGVSYSRSDDSSDDHHYPSSSDDQHLLVISSEYAQAFQHVQKPQVADFNISDWSEYNLSHDSPNMSIFRPVVNDQKKYINNNKNSNIQDFYIQDQQFDSTAKECQPDLVNNNITSSFAYPEIIHESLAGPHTMDMSYAFENSFAPNWPKMLQSPSPQKQLNTSTKHANANNSVPFWDCWMGNDESVTHESHQLRAPVMIEDRKPCNYGNPASAINLISPNVSSKDMIAQNSASGSTLLGTKRKNTTTREELYKRPRFETPSSLPTFKVRKEKLGDRVTALQQLVSPFGKTDTASVLHEAIEYIKFLHDQVSVLRTPYMQNGTPTNQGEWANAGSECPRHDLKSHGLCLVPISSTFPVANETTADFWTPTFGGTMSFG